MATKIEALLDWWQNSEVGRRHAQQAEAESRTKAADSRRTAREKLQAIEADTIAKMPKLNKAVDDAEAKLATANRAVDAARLLRDEAVAERRNVSVRNGQVADQLRAALDSMPDDELVEFQSWIEGEIKLLQKKKEAATDSEPIRDMEGKRTGDRTTHTDWWSRQRRMAGLIAARRSAVDLRYVVSADLDGEIAKIKAAIPEVALEPLEQTKTIVSRIRGMVSL